MRFCGKERKKMHTIARAGMVAAVTDVAEMVVYAGNALT
jgi:hypothetical protein